ncbi:MAG: hypothetical protein ACHBNF_17325 [Chromatiales bacterium]
MKLLTRQGYLIEEQGMTYLADSDPETPLGPLQAAACTYPRHAEDHRRPP